MKMSEIQRGECFSFSGLRWLAIEPTDRGTYALLDSVPELLKRRPFANLSTRRGKDLSNSGTEGGPIAGPFLFCYLPRR